MRVLVDNCVPRRFAAHIAGHETTHASTMGWGGLTDRQLLDAMEGQFDALVTVDQSLQYQQRISGRAFAVPVLRPVSNRLNDLVPLVPGLLNALAVVNAGEVREIDRL